MQRLKQFTWAIVAILVVGSGWLADRAWARGTGPDADPRVIPYAGRLDLDGNPVSAAVPMTFTLRGVMPGGATQSVSFPATNVNVFNGAFQALIGQGVGVPGWVYAAEQVYVSVTVGSTPLAGESRIYPVAFSTFSAESRDLVVESSLRVNGPITSTGDIGISAPNGQMSVSNDFAFRDTGTSALGLRAGPNSSTPASLDVDDLMSGKLRPRYSNWGNGEGAGGATIANDNSGYQALMVVGNNSAGDARRVKMYDDVTVDRDLNVNRNASVSGTMSTGNYCQGGYCGLPFITCGWTGERAVFGDSGCNDDIWITCTNGHVTAMRFSC